MSANLIWVYGGLALAIFCCGWALLRGGPVEKRGAAIILVAWVLTLLLQAPGRDGPGNWVIFIDILAMCALICLSVWSRKLWTLFAAALQIDTVASHFTAGITHFSVYSYVTATGLLGGEGLLIVLVTGTIVSDLNRRRNQRLKSKQLT